MPPRCPTTPSTLRSGRSRALLRGGSAPHSPLRPRTRRAPVSARRLAWTLCAMNHRQALLLVSVLLLFGCGYGSEKGYHGAGRVTVIHRVPVTALKVDFPDFHLNKPFHVKYGIAGLPASNYTYAVGLAIDAPIDDLLPSWSRWPGAQAMLELCVLDASGKPLVQCKGELYRFNWH